MIDADDLVSLVRNYNPKTNEALIRGAYDYARRMHEGQTRHSGEPYFTHPVSVAAILTEQRLDDATIMTALLHDTIEDNEGHLFRDRRGIRPRRGRAGRRGGPSSPNLELSSRETKQAENFRKLFMAMSKDLRVILVEACRPAAQHAHDPPHAARESRRRRRMRRWTSMRRSPAGWACNGCATSSRTCRSGS